MATLSRTCRKSQAKISIAQVFQLHTARLIPLASRLSQQWNTVGSNHAVLGIDCKSLADALRGHTWELESVLVQGLIMAIWI